MYSEYIGPNTVFGILATSAYGLHACYLITIDNNMQFIDSHLFLRVTNRLFLSFHATYNNNRK